MDNSLPERYRLNPEEIAKKMDEFGYEKNPEDETYPYDEWSVAGLLDAAAEKAVREARVDTLKLIKHWLFAKLYGDDLQRILHQGLRPSTEVPLTPHITLYDLEMMEGGAPDSYFVSTQLPASLPSGKGEEG